MFEDTSGKLNVKKLDLIAKTEENYLTYTNYNLIAIIDYAKKHYPLLNRQISQSEDIVMNNGNISLIDANSMLYNNEVFINNLNNI